MSELTFLLLGYALEHLLASGIIALVVLTLCRTKAISPGVKARILLAALLLSVFGPVVPVPDGTGADTGSAFWQADAAPMRVAGNASGRFDSDVADRTSWTPSNIEIGQPMAMLLMIFWLLGATWQLARQARGYAGLRGIIATSKRSRVLEDDYRHLLRAGVEIRLCASFGPAVVGVLHPKILIPERLAVSLPEDALCAVLLHEATHIRRNDVVGYIFQKVAEAVFWWNPMIRWMGTTLDATREIACDIEASRGCKTPADYADALLTAIEQIVPSQEGRFASALGVTDALKTLDQRIDGIIETRTASGPWARLVSLGVLLAMAAAWAAAGAAARPLAPIPAGSSDITSVRPLESKPTAAEAEDSKQTAAVERAERSTLSADKEYRHAASQADREYTTVAQAADAEYQHTAAQADREYTTAAQAADARYLQRFAELEHVTPGDASEAGLSKASREGERTMAAANTKYRTAMSAVNAKYKTTMSVVNAKYKAEMAQAKERFESATKASHMN